MAKQKKRTLFDSLMVVGIRTFGELFVVYEFFTQTKNSINNRIKRKFSEHEKKLIKTFPSKLSKYIHGNFIPEVTGLKNKLGQHPIEKLITTYVMPKRSRLIFQKWHWYILFQFRNPLFGVYLNIFMSIILI